MLCEYASGRKSFECVFQCHRSLGGGSGNWSLHNTTLSGCVGFRVPTGLLYGYQIISKACDFLLYARRMNGLRTVPCYFEDQCCIKTAYELCANSVWGDPRWNGRCIDFVRQSCGCREGRREPEGKQWWAGLRPGSTLFSNTDPFVTFLTSKQSVRPKRWPDELRPPSLKPRLSSPVGSSTILSSIIVQALKLVSIVETWLPIPVSRQPSPLVVLRRGLSCGSVQHQT